MPVANTLAVGTAPATGAVTKWPSLIESALAVLAITALLPLFESLAANDAGRDRRFAATAIVIGGLPERTLHGLCTSHGAGAEPIVRDRLCRWSESLRASTSTVLPP